MVAITAKAAMPDEAMLQTFSVNILDKPEVFLTKGDEYAEQAKAMTKHLYDLGKASETEDMKGQCSMLEELFIDGFDNEQIWEEIQMQNAPFLTYLKSQLATLKAGKTSAEKEKEKEADEGTDGEHEEMEVDEDKDGMMDSDMEHDSDMLDSAVGDEEEDAEELDDEEEVAKDDDDEQDLEEEEEEEESEEEDLDDLDLPATKKAKTSEVDDDFFKLEEFNALTEKQEQDELEGRESENDDEIDYFADPDEIESGDDFSEDDEDDENLVDAHDVKYNDFFAPVKTSRSKAKSASKKPKTRDTDGKEDEDDFGFSDEEEKDTEQKEDEEEEEDVKVNALGDRISDLFSKDADDDDEDESKLSKFERMQRKMQAQIELLEQENVAPKEWTVKGETSAADRPVNSLLEEDLEFETVAKPVPVITAETTKTLEDIIKDRILNNNFDDVVRKQPPNPKAFNPSSRVEISDEKSKKSLAELYEDEYTRQTNTGAGPVLTEKEAALEKQHEEITEAWKELCSKLDALSNWHYTPKPVKAELTVVTNAAAISMEEAIPVGVADAALLAPEEIYSAGKAPIKGDSEMDQTDRKRKRAQAKRAKKAEIKEKAKQAAERQKEREERDRRLGRQPGDKGNSKTVVRDKLEAMEKLSGQKNISFIDRDGNKRSSIKQGSQVDTSKSAKLKL